MKINKIIKLLFLLLLICSSTVLVYLSLNISNLLSDTALTLQGVQQKYNGLQQQTSLTSIILFAVLLLVAFTNYYINNNPKYIVLANIMYILVTLYNYITLNHNFYSMQGFEPAENSGYWLILFIGIFYIIGAVLISVIGFFTIKNLNKRSKNNVNN